VLLELQQGQVADARLNHALCTKAITAWRQGAAMERSEREAAARHAEVWGKVRGWLAELHREREEAVDDGGQEAVAGGGVVGEY